MSEPQVDKLQTNERAKEVRPNVDTVKDGVDAKHAGTAAKGKDAHAATNLAKVGAANEAAHGESHGEHGEAHLDLHALGEEQIRDVVFFRGKTWLSPSKSVDRADGALAGLQRYDGKTPRRPKADAPDQDEDYDHELWHHAMHRLEEIAIQSEAGGEVEYHSRVGVSTNNASRSERREADEKLQTAKDRVEEKENTKGHAGIGAAKRAENRADKERDKVYDKTRDPLGEAKEKAENAEEHEKTKTATEQREAIDKVKSSQAAYEAALKRFMTPAKGPGSTEANEEAKAEAIKAKLEFKAALAEAEKLGANRGLLGKAYDKLKEHTEVEIGGDLINVVKTTGDKEVWGERHDGVSTGTQIAGQPITKEGETHLLSARGDAKGVLSVGKNGLNAEASVGGKAVLVEAREQWKWEMPGKFMGEDVNTRLYFQVSGMIGAEAKAKLKANVGGLNPKEPKLDMNAVSAGVEGFAGMKASVAVGAAFEWQKKGAAAYNDKVANAGKVMVDIITAINPPLGFILRQMDADTAAAKMMAFLMEWGKSGTVPLAAIEASIEGSAGIGGVAQAGIGLRGGQLDFMAEANATFGVGLGGKVKVSLDIVEGPKFALITLGELRPIAIKFAQDKIKQGIDMGSAFVGNIAHAISDWWNSKDKAHQLVSAKVPDVLPAAKNVEVIDSLFGWYCQEDDQAAVLQVLQAMKRHGQTGTITGAFSQKILGKLDGTYHKQAGAIMGAKTWK